jgi:hypothetical protein
MTMTKERTPKRMPEPSRKQEKPRKCEARTDPGAFTFHAEPT